MKRHSLLAILLALGQVASAQDEPLAHYRQYATQQYMKQLLADNPEVVETRAAIERQTYEFARTGMPDTPTIQVVFHLIGDVASTITELDVQAQMDALNRDFNLPQFLDSETAHPAWEAEGFKDKAAMPSIQFCLSRKDPSDQPASGIVYVNSTSSSFPVGTEVTNPEKGGAAAWPTDRYLNVWVAQLDEGKAGYAQMPGGPKESDGIVLDVSYFARKDKEAFLAANPSTANYYMGRTLSHLVGSYFNLYELWNEERPCTDDYVADTPIHNAPNYAKPGYRHISTCTDIPVEMTMNLMDNTDDDAQFMFTNGQMMRLYASLALDGPRANLRILDCSIDTGHFGGGIPSRRDEVAQTNGLALSVTPNPASDGFTLLITSGYDMPIKILVFSGMGIQQGFYELEDGGKGTTRSIFIDTREWPAGLYVIQARCENESLSKKILIGK